MEQRTEEQKIAQAPIVVVLGGKEYPVKPLVIRDSRVWRQKVVKMLAALPNLTKDINPANIAPQQFETAVSSLLVSSPDEVINLFFEYARDLNREELEALATDTEIAKGFEQVVNLAFPLFRTLVKTMSILAQ